MSRADDIAQQHLMTHTSGCTCGSVRLGSSYARHLVEVTQEAIARDIEAWEAEQEAGDVLPTDVPQTAWHSGVRYGLLAGKHIARGHHHTPPANDPQEDA